MAGIVAPPTVVRVLQFLDPTSTKTVLHVQPEMAEAAATFLTLSLLQRLRSAVRCPVTNATLCDDVDSTLMPIADGLRSLGVASVQLSHDSAVLQHLFTDAIAEDCTTVCLPWDPVSVYVLWQLGLPNRTPAQHSCCLTHQVALLGVKYVNFRLVVCSSRESLQYAISDDHSPCVALLTHNGVDPNGFTSLFESPAHLACRRGRSRCLEVLLSRRIHLEALSENRTAAFAACASGSVECLEQLMKAGARLATTNHGGMSALAIATKKRHVACVRVLLSSDEISKADRADAFAAIPFHDRDVTLLRLYLDDGIRPARAESILQCGAEALDLLQQYDVDLNVSGVLTAAAHQGRWALLERLDPSTFTSELLVLAGRFASAVHVILTKRPDLDVNYSDARGKTVLQAAVVEHDVDLVKFMLSKGAKDNAAHDAARIATKLGHLDTLHLLHQVHGDGMLLSVNSTGDTLLHDAVASGNVALQCVKFLLKRVPQLASIRNRRGATPALKCFENHAFSSSVLPCLEALLDAGAAVEDIDGEGRSVLHYALLSYGASEYFRALGKRINTAHLLQQRDRYGATPFEFVKTRAPVYQVMRLSAMLSQYAS